MTHYYYFRHCVIDLCVYTFSVNFSDIPTNSFINPNTNVPRTRFAARLNYNYLYFLWKIKTELFARTGQLKIINTNDLRLRRFDLDPIQRRQNLYVCRQICPTYWWVVGGRSCRLGNFTDISPMFYLPGTFLLPNKNRVTATLISKGFCKCQNVV